MPIPAPSAAPAPNADPLDALDGPRPLLGLREAVTLIVGVVVGAGIFKAPALVAGMTDDVPWMFLAWALGGVVSLAGALCYAELCTAYAHPGGDYHFLQLAYGRGLAFLFGWARYAVITTGSIALLAFVFGDYLQQVLPLPAATPALGAAAWAALAVVALAALNLAGLRGASLAQTGLTLLEVAALLAVAAAAAVLPARPRPHPRHPPQPPRPAPVRRRPSAWRWCSCCWPTAAGTKPPISAPKCVTAAATWCARWYCRSA